MTGYILAAPALIAFALFAAWPLVELARLSMYRTDFITTKFVGFANYARIFTDPAFLLSIGNSFAYMGIMLVLTVGGAIVTALIVIDENKKWHDAIRIMLYLPMITAGILISQVWRWIFHAEGLINWILGTEIFWFAQGATAIPAVGLIVSLSGVGGSMIILLAAALSIDQSLYDAARIDGATPGRIKRSITLPLIAPTIGVISLLAIIAAPQVFETIYALAPYEYAASMGYHIYREAFQMSRFGTAAAQSVVMFGILVTIAAAKNRIRT